MKAKRLLKLADFLDTIPKRMFDMGTFGNHDFSHFVEMKDKPPLKKIECGMRACAGGWATQIESFAKKGLYWDHDIGCIRLKDSDVRDFAALAEFFDINGTAANYLFGGGHEQVQTPKEVAKHIRNFVELDSK